MDFWEAKLRSMAAPLDSLLYFKPSFMSLATPHPIWTSAGSSPAKVTMATIQAQMLSGRYRTEALCSHWKPLSNGSCLLSPSCSSSTEDLDHILYKCCALEDTRIKLKDYTVKYCRNVPSLSPIITHFLSSSCQDFCQFLLDCSTIPDVIAATRLHGHEYVHHHLFNITRTWVYSLHKARLKILGRWNIV